MTCAGCRREFSAAEANRVCASCSAFGGCHFVCCPHCGYEQPQQPGWVAKLTSLFSRGPTVQAGPGEDADATVRLDQVPTGGSGRVLAVHRFGGHWRKFMAMGIHPGVSLTVEQRFPALVVLVGQTRVAMDFQAASLVEVEPSDSPGPSS